MASKRTQDFVGRNVGKSVEVTLTNGRTFKGTLETHERGFTIKSGRRGRPPVFSTEDIKQIKHWTNPEAGAVRGTPTNAEPQITQPVNTAKESYPAPQTRKAANKTQQRRNGKPTAEQLADAEALAEAELASV